MPGLTYAKGTEVSVAKSKTEIEQTLSRFGASHFGYAWREGAAVIQFVARDRQVRFVMQLPKKDEDAFQYRTRYHRRVKNTPEEAEKLWEAACRQYWRALNLLVKAKLAAVEAGITTFEDEFLAHVVTPDGQTIGQWLRPQLASAYSTGKMPPLLPGVKED